MKPALLALLKGQTEIAFDYECTSLNVFTLRILGAAFANTNGDTYFALSTKEIVEAVEYCNQHSIQALIYNARYDLSVSLSKGIPLFDRFQDVYAAVKLFDERWTGKAPYRLSSVAARLVDRGLASYKDEFMEYLKTKYGPKASYDSVQDKEDFEKLAEYAETDALCTMLIWEKIFPVLKKQNLLSVLELENTVVRSLIDVHLDGVTVDREYLQASAVKLREIIQYIEDMSVQYTDSLLETALAEDYAKWKKRQALNEKKGRPVEERYLVNMGSAPQVGKVLNAVGVKSPALTASGKPSWGADVLAVIDHPFAKMVNDYRGFNKLLTSFVDPWLEHSARDGRLHTEFNHYGATTGRMSSSNPNMQQMPRFGKSIDTDDLGWVNQTMKDNPEMARELQKRRQGWSLGAVLGVINKDDAHLINVRRAVVADTSDHRLIKIDYQQMEAAVFAHFAEEDTMIATIEGGRDIHTEMAASLFPEAAVIYNLPGQKLDEKGIPTLRKDEFKAYRLLAKGVIFGLLYGIGPRTLGLQIGKSQKEAKALMESWFGQFPKTKAFIDKCYREIDRQGYVETFMGRRRRLYPGEAYKAVNAIVQGSCADFVKASLVTIHRDLWPRAVIKLVIHDEFVIQAHKDDVEILLPEIQHRMTDFATNPKLKTDYSVGYRYGEETEDVETLEEEIENQQFVEIAEQMEYA